MWYVIVLIVSIVVYYIVMRMKYPGPYPLPYYGNYYHFKRYAKVDQGNNLGLYQKWIQNYGDTLYFSSFDRPFVLTVDPKVIEYVLVTGFNLGYYGKSPYALVQYEDFLGDGIFNSNGQLWKNARMLGKGLFHVNSLKGDVGIYLKNAEILFQKLEDVCMRGEDINVQEEFGKYTLDVFSEVGFGYHVNSLRSESCDFAEAFDYIQTFTNKRSHNPNVFNEDEVYDRHLNFINDLLTSIIEEKKECLGTSNSHDILEKIIQEYDLTDKELRDFVMNFLLAGRDTTALMLTWTFYLLSQNPDVKRKVREEIFLNINSVSDISWNSLKKLDYLRNVFLETLRLYPPVPTDGFFAFEDNTLPGGYFVKKGTMVLYCSYALHRSEKYYSNPEEFDPDRYETNPVPFTYLPFHGGPRTCMGKEMAILEGQALISYLFLRGLSFEMNQEKPVLLKKAILLNAKDGVWLYPTTGNIC